MRAFVYYACIIINYSNSFFPLFSFHAQHCRAGRERVEEEDVAGADSGKYARKNNNNNNKHGQHQHGDGYYQANNDVENELTLHQTQNGAGYAAVLTQAEQKLFPLPLPLPDSNVARVINNGDEDNSASASSSSSSSSEQQPDIIPYPLSVGETSWKAEKQRRQQEEMRRWGRT